MASNPPATAQTGLKGSGSLGHRAISRHSRVVAVEFGPNEKEDTENVCMPLLSSDVGLGYLGDGTKPQTFTGDHQTWHLVSPKVRRRMPTYLT